MVIEWPSADPSAWRSHELLVNELLLQFLDFAESYYVLDGELSQEVANLKIALRPLKALYGGTPAQDFGRTALKAVRQWMVDKNKLCRKEINKRVGRIKRVFKWAVSEELVPPSVFEGLRTVDGLRRGRTTAADNPSVKPVDDRHVEAILPFLSPQVAAMVQLQRITGMRPGEVTLMRPMDVDRTQDVWIYRPRKHKTSYLGVTKEVPLGPRAQELIRPFWERPDEAYLFSPAEFDSAKTAETPVRIN
jgi:integrase